MFIAGDLCEIMAFSILKFLPFMTVDSNHDLACYGWSHLAL